MTPRDKFSRLGKYLPDGKEIITFLSGKYFREEKILMVTAPLASPATRSAGSAEEIQGLPVWYFVMVGLLAGSGDISRQFRDSHPWVVVLPLVLVGVHFVLWLAVLRRRAKYVRAVWRSPKALALAVTLFVCRMLMGVGLGVLGQSGVLHQYRHLVMGLAMVGLTTGGAWFDQWLILRTLRGQRR